MVRAIAPCKGCTSESCEGTFQIHFVVIWQMMKKENESHCMNGNR